MNILPQSEKFPLSLGFMVDNSKCRAITVREFYKHSRWISFFKVVYLYLTNSNPMSIFIGCGRKTSIIRKNWFWRIIENIRHGSRVSPRQAAIGLAQRLQHFTSLRPTLPAFRRIAPTKASLWSGKINQLHLFLRQEVINYTLDLIRVWLDP